MARTLRLSARNQFKGKVVEVKTGVTTSHVRVDIGGGHVVTASITNESAEDLGLANGKSAIVIIKSSNLMVGVD
jgi:molybdopterin-binding protein